MAEHANSTTLPEVQALPNLDAISIAHLTGRQLLAVYDALTAVDEALTGSVNQPRCWGGNDLNSGGKVIETLMQWAGMARDAVTEAAERAVSSTRQDAEYCRWVVVKHHASMSDDLMEVVRQAATPLLVQGGAR